MTNQDTTQGGTPPQDAQKPKIDVDEIVAEADSGSRVVPGTVGFIIAGIAFIWSCFQLYIASDLPFFLTELTGVNFTFNNVESRNVHLAFALILVSFAYPLYKGAPKDAVPWYDWLLAAVGAICCLYLIFVKESLVMRAGLPTVADLTVSAVGMMCLAIGVYRALGLPMLVVAGVFLTYTFFGNQPWMPEVIQWRGASFGKAMWHYWMQTEGVFGVALAVSATMIFLFVLFGSLLERAGAGYYFIKLAFALLGHLRGGPAKAAVLASAASGLYSGSSIANVVTTGTFTIPLMKKTGFKPEKAGAVEVASSTNGQLTPPVMGAAAFLIAEFTGISYTDILKHALVPALISYIALIYIVHLEALKLGLKGMEKPPSTGTLAQKLIGFLTGFLGLAALGGVVYFGLGWVKEAFPGMGFWTGVAIFLAAYLFLLRIAAQRPDLPIDDPNDDIKVLPRPGEVAVTGLHFLLPIVVLLWCILIERLSPAFSAYWGTLSMIFVVVTQHPIKAMFRAGTEFADQPAAAEWKRGVGDFVFGMIAGARNMIPIAVATGVAGVIIGTVTLTGAHQVVGDFVEFLSGGSLILMLLLVAVMSLLLGLGLPTTANYIVVSSLMAPVIVSVGASQGLVVPLIAVHLFVFYFGILADDTPPVGLAAFAASAISGGDPIKTGLQGFAYDIRTALLPFLFIFNTELLLIDVGLGKAIFVFCVGVIAMMLFAAATQSYFFARNRWWETIALLLIAFTLFRPGYWLDQVDPRYEFLPGTQLTEIAESMPADSRLRIEIRGPDFDDLERMTQTTVLLNLGEEGPGQERLEREGILIAVEGEDAILEEPFAGTPYFTTFQMFEFYGDEFVTVDNVQIERERMPKEVFYIPALLLLGFVIMMQRRRQTVPAF
ncbi:MAG: TRAP transporter permease [Devosiaceae bacterium]